MIDTSEVLITHEQIQEMLDRLAAELNRDYAGRPLVVVGILTGAFIFCSDLVRRLEMPVIVDFMQVSSYVGEISTGNLKIKKDMSYDIAGKDVLIVEDIIDTGESINRLISLLKEQNPASVSVAAFLRKITCPVGVIREKVYSCFDINDCFTIGYGMDWKELFRNLPSVYYLADNGA